MPGAVAPFYRGWSLLNDALIAVIAPLTPDQLRVEIRPGWPVWASVAHLAGGRVYWLCAVFGEPGAETTPFSDPERGGWEDDPAHPRDARELVDVLASTWRIVDRTLETWTVDTLEHETRRVRGATVQLHTRQSVLWRMITHDAFHIGEISNTLGSHGLGSADPNGAIDLWSRLPRLAE